MHSMTVVVIELQGASDRQQPPDWLKLQDAESPSVSADAVDQADLAAERMSEPLAGPPPGIIKGIVYW
jgi:hypothetical protein